VEDIELAEALGDGGSGALAAMLAADLLGYRANVLMTADDEANEPQRAYTPATAALLFVWRQQGLGD
jgi:hypothetical protein